MDTKNFHIFIGYHDEKFLNKVVTILRQWYTVSASIHGAEIPSKIFELRPDLAILDYNIREIDIINLCERMSTDYPETYIVMCANLEQLPVARKKWCRRAFDYIIVPIGPEEFGEEVNKAVRYIFVERQREQLIRYKIELRYHLNNHILKLKQLILEALNAKNWDTLHLLQEELQRLDDTLKDIDSLS